MRRVRVRDLREYNGLWIVSGEPYTKDGVKTGYGGMCRTWKLPYYIVDVFINVNIIKPRIHGK